MAKPMKTPGVYIVEKDAFPNSIVEVETAVPAFIGYTEKAEYKGSDLTGTPTQVASLGEYMELFGGAPNPSFTLTQVDDPAEPGSLGVPDELADFRFNGARYRVQQSGGFHLLFNSLRIFFANGGGKCFIVSVGSYADDISKDTLKGGIEPLIKEQVPTMIVIPEAIRLTGPGNSSECKDVQTAVLAHCSDMANRFGILDVYDGWKDLRDKVVDTFRNDIGTNGLKYGAAYYPWIHTSVVSDRDFGIENLDDRGPLKEAIAAEKLSAAVESEVASAIDSVTETAADLNDLTPERRQEIDIVNDTVRSNSQVYQLVMRKMQSQVNLMPPSAAMAGIYTRVDNQRGVWKAPANVSISMVNKPAVTVSHLDQEDLNVTPQGKSVNAIREFVGEGVIVWGGRTLDGNSLDWRYINVRRTLIMLEESVKLAAKAYVFEANTANTWITMKSMISNFLTGIWKRGGLAGASPEDAFSVHVGLGETMTPEDILEGILRITVLVAPVRPAEFIEITFQQQQQKS